MTQTGTDVTLMVDHPAHIERIERFCQEQAGGAGHTPVRVCVDVDMSYRTAGMHIGVQRSPLRSLEEFGELARRIAGSRHLDLHGVMGYEAQVAGLGESNPFTPVLNPLKRLIKSRSIRDVRRQRKAIADWLEREGLSIAVFNGGGTGSIQSTSREPWISEVTAGSGFLQSHLFDYFRSNQNQPAFCFGLMVMRKPQDNIVTCQSGGFIASGEIGPDKQPMPFLPEGLKATKLEGFGEVQTPLTTREGLDLQPGDPVFFRPAKAGEIAERFDEYLLVSGGKIIERPRTYRGLGHCFF
jgi:D-serine deaminase-like pyridoxal phosphate-dependent protein